MRERISVWLATVLVAAGGVVVAAQALAGATANPSVSVGDASVVEGDSGSVLVQIPVDLDFAASAKVKVPFTIGPANDGTTDTGDVVSVSGKLTFSAGVTSKLLKVTVISDTTIEPDQHIEINLGTPIGPATLGDAQGIVTVVDDDTDGIDPGIEVSLGDVTVHEADGGAHYAYLPVTLSRPASTKISLSFRAGCSTTTMGADVSAPTAGKITFAAGQQSKLVKVRISADLAPEDLESFVEAIKAAVGPVNVIRPTGAVEIVDNDGSGAPPPDPLSVGQIEQVSITSGGAPAQYPIPTSQNGGGFRRSEGASVSADGRYVAFSSDACNLVPNDTNDTRDVFVRDRIMGTTERVDFNADGSQVDASQVAITHAWGVPFWPPSISADGRFVAYTTSAGLVPQDSQFQPGAGLDVYVYDRVAHTTELVSARPDGTAAGAAIWSPSISGDGRFIAFTVGGSVLTSLPTTPPYNTFVRDRVAGTTTQALTGTYNPPVISANGRYVVQAQWQGPGETNARLVLHDLQTDSNEFIDVTTSGQDAQEGLFAELVYTPSISSDGRYVAFKSYAWNLNPIATGPYTYNGLWPIDRVLPYLRDRLMGTTTLVGPTATPQNTYWYTEHLGLSDDGSEVAIVNGFSGGQGKVFDVATGTQTPFGLPVQPGAQNNSLQTPNAMSADGRFIVWMSESWPFGDVYIQRIR